MRDWASSRATCWINWRCGMKPCWMTWTSCCATVFSFKLIVAARSSLSVFLSRSGRSACGCRSISTRSSNSSPFGNITKSP
eukprot:560809-Pyramimonas_sp.AAC.1